MLVGGPIRSSVVDFALVGEEELITVPLIGPTVPGLFLLGLGRVCQRDRDYASQRNDQDAARRTSRMW